MGITLQRLRAVIAKFRLDRRGNVGDHDGACNSSAYQRGRLRHRLFLCIDDKDQVGGGGRSSLATISVNSPVITTAKNM